MANIVPFTTSRQRLQHSKIKLKSCKASTRNSWPNVKRAVGAANVFQQLALENRYGLEMLERLARTMLDETRRRVANYDE